MEAFVGHFGYQLVSTLRCLGNGCYQSVLMGLRGYDWGAEDCMKFTDLHYL